MLRGSSLSCSEFYLFKQLTNKKSRRKAGFLFYTNIIFYFLIFFVFVCTSDIYAYRDVCYYAKIRILKQIITVKHYLCDQ